MLCRSQLAALVFVSLATGTALAAPPTATTVFPAGTQRGTTVEVKVGGTFDTWPCRVWVSGNGVSAVAGKVKGTFNVTATPDAVPGVYFLRFHDDSGASGLRPFLVGLLSELVEKEPNDAPDQAQAMSGTSLVMNGKLEKSGDVDCFAVTAKKGQTLVADLEANRSLKSPMDSVVQILMPDGGVLTQSNDEIGLDSRATFTAPSDGTYLVRVFAFPSTPDASIRFAGGDTFIYRLTITTGPFVDYAWPLAVPKASPGTVALVGWNLPTTAKATPVPAAVDGIATIISTGFGNATTVRVAPHPCVLASELSAKNAPTPAPVTVSGRLDGSATADAFLIAGKKGQPLTLQLESRELGFALTPVIRVFDTAGKQLLRAESPVLNQDVSTTFSPPVDGNYRVEVFDLFRATGPRYAYRLRVLPAEPDFELTMPADRIVVAPEQPTEVVVTVVRRNGFAKDVVLTVVGLPTGIVATVVPPKGKPDPKAMTLRFTTEKTGIAASVRIVGRSGDLERVATTAVTELETRTRDLWLAATTSPVPKPTPKKKR